MKYHAEQHWIADDLAGCTAVELAPHRLDHQRVAQPGDPAFMPFLDARVLAGVEGLLAKHAGFDDYLREQGATS